MLYAVAALVVCWGIGVYGVVTHAATSMRMIRGGTVFPVRGMRVATARVPARLADLVGESGTCRGLLWARTADGIACRPSSHWFTVVAQCRQDGDDVLVETVLPQGVRLFYVGMIGFMAIIVITIGTLGGRQDLGLAIPVGLLLLAAVQYVLHVRRARSAGLLLPRYVEAACADAAASPNRRST